MSQQATVNLQFNYKVVDKFWKIGYYIDIRIQMRALI